MRIRFYQLTEEEILSASGESSTPKHKQHGLRSRLRVRKFASHLSQRSEDNLTHKSRKEVSLAEMYTAAREETNRETPEKQNGGSGENLGGQSLDRNRVKVSTGNGP